MDIQGVKKRLLVADDHPDVADMLAELIYALAPFPLEIAVVYGGAAALAKALLDRPDCAILDIDMPSCDGATAALAMRSALGAGAPVLIALTADSRHADSPRTRGAFDHFFEKPADADVLISLVARAPHLFR